MTIGIYAQYAHSTYYIYFKTAEVYELFFCIKQHFFFIVNLGGGLFVVVVCAVFALCRDVLETHDFSKVQGNKISPHCTVHKIMKMTEIVQKVGFYFKRITKKLVFALCCDVLETRDFFKV